MLLPKGRIFENIKRLLSDAGLELKTNGKDYVPASSDDRIRCKLMKPQNIAELVEYGFHDCGFTGYDWVVESGAEVVELLDTGFDSVRIVSAVPAGAGPGLPGSRIYVATEYKSIALDYLERKNLDYVLIRSFGATEAFPPDDADMIIDNTSTGRTLRENGLEILDTLLFSSTRFIASKRAMDNAAKRESIEGLVMLFRAVLDARNRVMLEMNVSTKILEAVVELLPCMRAPTVAPLYNDEGYAVKAAVKRDAISTLIPKLKSIGVTDILESEMKKVIV